MENIGYPIHEISPAIRRSPSTNEMCYSPWLLAMLSDLAARNPSHSPSGLFALIVIERGRAFCTAHGCPA
jgi:hypothetical protein